MDISITDPRDVTGLIVLLIVAVLIPLLVDLVAKRFANPSLKAWLLVILSLLNGLVVSFITAHNAGVDFDWKGALLAFFVSIITSATSLFAVLRPVGISGANGAIERALPGGVGSPVDPNSPYVPDPGAPVVTPGSVPIDPQAPVVEPGVNPPTTPVPGRHSSRPVE